MYLNRTLLDWLEEHAETRPGQVAILCDAEMITYRQLYAEIQRVAGGLQSLGLKKGDVVAVQLPNIPEYITAYLAISGIGGIMQTLHMPYRQAELSYLLADSKAGAVICLDRFQDDSPAALIMETTATLDPSPQIISVGGSPAGTMDFHRLLSGNDSIRIQTRPEPDDEFVLLYTSGTTSSPKGVPHRYNNFLTNAHLCCEAYEFTENEKILSLAPLTHLYGLFSLNMALSCAATSVLLPVFEPQAFIDTVRTRHPTAIFAAPAHFAICEQKGLLKPEDFVSVRFVCLSGSTVMPELAKKIDSLLVNGKVGQLWGMSELQAGAITRPGDDAHTRFHSAGHATPGTELRIADEEKVLPANSEGELQVKGLSVFDGYLNRPRETQKAFTRDGWFRSGDLAIINDEGHLLITGRTKAVINRGGIKFNPVEVELIISQLPGVLQCAITPRPDKVLGEISCLFVVTHPGITLELENIHSTLQENGIARYKWPEEMHSIDRMPMTPTNKVRLDALARLLDKKAQT